eukprot:gb/GEZJ01004274.1/.p1 GENE.gb/GEZJ01004274.1/~~gb/GEZJ01004274.1/.p1  ORF type:complete len:111 (-),score=4.91 gb/GEZJ01004274.1/:47-340(-)
MEYIEWKENFPCERDSRSTVQGLNVFESDRVNGNCSVDGTVMFVVLKGFVRTCFCHGLEIKVRVTLLQKKREPRLFLQDLLRHTEDAKGQLRYLMRY